MPLLALSMLCTTLIGIEPNSHYATRTLLIAIFRIDVVWIWITHKACTLYVGGNRTHRQNPNVFNPYACLLPIRCLPFCIHINSRSPPTSADTRTRTLITILLVREISNLLWYHYTISANGWKRNRTSIVYHVGTDLQSAATPPSVAVHPEFSLYRQEH